MHPLVKHLRRLLAPPSAFHIQVEPITALPPGLWLYRSAPSGTALDLLGERFVHPLELLSLDANKDAADKDRVSVQRLCDTRMTLDGALAFWGMSLGLKPEAVRKWYWTFTPVVTTEPPAHALLQRQADVWDFLGVPEQAWRDTLQALALTPVETLGPAVYRPGFWTMSDGVSRPTT